MTKSALFDTHTHSYFSPDGHAMMEAMLLAARAHGLQGMAITEHAEWIPGDEGYGYLDLNAYFNMVNAMRDIYPDFTLLAGIELGNPEGFLQEVAYQLDRWSFDFVIGSVHWVDDLPGWEDVFFESGLKTAYQRYFEQVLTMVQVADFDILGHLDLVRRDSWSLYRKVMPLEPFCGVIHAILETVIDRGKGIEVNTSGLRKGLGAPNPGLEVLRWYHDLGGRVLTFGSDAHFPEHVAFGFDIARDLAHQAGFTHLARFKQRQVNGWISL